MEGLKALDDMTPLHDAAGEGNYEEVIAFIKEGANIDAQNNHGWTPLFLASMRRNEEIVEVLLANGADPNIKTVDGMTPLHTACYSGPWK